METSPTERMLVMEHEVGDLRKEISSNFNYMKEKLDLILEQTTKTNGRVTKIEQERLPKLETWQAEIRGGTKVAYFVWSVIGTYIIGSSIVLLNMWADWRNQKLTIQEVVRQELQGFALEEVK